MSRFGTFGIILATSVALAATPALAIIKVATISGVITRGFDSSIFGGPTTTARNLTGQAYSIAFTYDTSVANRETGTASSPGGATDFMYTGVFQQYSQGPGPSFFTSISVTVNGLTGEVYDKDFPSDYSSNLDYSEMGVVNTLDPVSQSVNYFVSRKTFIHNTPSVGQYNTFYSLESVFFSPERTTNLEVNTQGIASHAPTDVQPIPFSLTMSRYYLLPTGRLKTYSTNIDGTVEAFSISDPVPEPANWVMMIAGFGLIGATQRRRRLTAHSVAA